MAGVLRNPPKRGDIFWVDFEKDKNVGSEKQKHRPALIISADYLNNALSVVTVAAITRSIRENNESSILILEQGEPLKERSAVLIFQVRTISKDRLEKFEGSLTKNQLLILQSKMKAVWDL